MTMQHLPRPWMLAALADVPVTLLARQEDSDGEVDWRDAAPPRQETRRRRLSTRHAARQWYQGWYAEDAWGGDELWHESEVDRAA